MGERGELTYVGMKQHYAIGRQNRLNYVDSQPFMSPTFNASEIKIISSNFRRTIQSAMSHLLGMYPFLLEKEQELHSRSETEAQHAANIDKLKDIMNV